MKTSALLVASSTLLAAFSLGLPQTSSAAPTPITSAAYNGSFTPGTPPAITGDATVASLTTAEGTFTGLIGATASGVTSQQVTSSVGTPPGGSLPGSLNAAVTGLSINDGVNNLGVGTFQLSLAINANTRFFIIESTPTTSTAGDNSVITLVNAQGAQVGTYTFNLQATSFTATAANTTNTALATVNYNNSVASVANSKLGGVTFSLADFTGTGDLSTVTGIAINGNNGLDPNVVGAFSTVPEPGTWATLAAGVALLAMGFRRKACRL